MTTPNWRRPCFSVAEGADLVDIHVDALRAWLARCPLDDFTGTKVDGRLWLSPCELYYYAVVSILARFGVPIRTAMLSAGPIAAFGKPKYAFLIVVTAAGRTEFQASNSRDVDGPALVIPLGSVYAQFAELGA